MYSCFELSLINVGHTLAPITDFFFSGDTVHKVLDLPNQQPHGQQGERVRNNEITLGYLKKIFSYFKEWKHCTGVFVQCVFLLKFLLQL